MKYCFGRSAINIHTAFKGMPYSSRKKITKYMFEPSDKEKKIGGLLKVYNEFAVPLSPDRSSIILLWEK